MKYHFMYLFKLGTFLTLIPYTALLFTMILTILLPYSSESYFSLPCRREEKENKIKFSKKTKKGSGDGDVEFQFIQKLLRQHSPYLK